MSLSISRLASRGPVKASFEFFPPTSEKMEARLWESVERLAPLQPEFVSVTYGAGGSTRERTHSTVSRIVQSTDMPVAAHLTCVDASKAEVNDVIQSYWQAGVRHIVALRGDPPEGVGKAYRPYEGGYANAAELATGIKAIGDFEISVGCYPEKHPESASIDADIDMLKAKVDAGADRAITQFCFDSDEIARYRDRVADAGIGIPIVPGIMPVASFKGLLRFAGGCGATVPAWMHDLFADLGDDLETHKLLAANVAAEQCMQLEEHGFDQFHFYTLNRADLSYATCYMLGMRPKTKEQDQ